VGYSVFNFFEKEVMSGVTPKEFSLFDNKYHTERKGEENV